MELSQSMWWPLLVEWVACMVVAVLTPPLPPLLLPLLPLAVVAVAAAACTSSVVPR